MFGGFSTRYGNIDEIWIEVVGQHTKERLQSKLGLALSIFLG
jgi:hypothetical protein